MDVDNSETDSDYNPGPNDFVNVNFVADMYLRRQVPGAGQHGPICYGGSVGARAMGA